MVNSDSVGVGGQVWYGVGKYSVGKYSVVLVLVGKYGMVWCWQL